MSRPKSATGRLEAAQAALEETTRKLGELKARRNECLLKDKDAEAAKLGAEIEALQHSARVHEDKIVLLKTATEQEAVERRAKENEQQNRRIDALFDHRDEDIAKLAALEEQRATIWRRVQDTNRKIVAAHSWELADLSACMLTPSSVNAALSHEAYRLSYVPRRYGGFDGPNAGQMLPGGACPRPLENMDLPERTLPMVDVFAAASEHGKARLRGEFRVADSARASAQAAAVTNGGDAPVANGQGERPPRTAAEQERDVALQELLRLGEDISPQGELRYKAQLEKVRQFEDAVAAEQGVGAQSNA
jgi:hypothetical protein